MGPSQAEQDRLAHRVELLCMADDAIERIDGLLKETESKERAEPEPPRRKKRSRAMFKGVEAELDHRERKTEVK